MNNKVKFLRGTSDEYAVAEKDNDTIYFTTDDGKLYIGDKEVSGDGSITIDDTLSDTSTNPVQNKVVKQAIDNKADKTVATADTDGLMSAEDKSKLDNADDTYALKSKYGDTVINVGRKAETDVGLYSTAEGYETTASGTHSHAEGYSTSAIGESSHAGGNYANASGNSSFSHGHYTKATHNDEIAFGKFNQSNDDTIFSVGDGTNEGVRHNAFEITKTGGKLHDKDIATTDLIPTSLPANGGNADYAADADKLDGLHANDFIKVNSSDAYDCNTLYDAGLYLCNGLATNTPNNLIYGTLFVMPYRKPYGNAGPDYCAQIFIPNGDADDPSLWYRTSLQNSWSEWKRSCDGGNADTVDGLHADDFVNATNRNNIQIPSNVDVPAWIYANGKRYQIYVTNTDNTGLTNVPNGSNDWVWYWFDGINIIAREWATGKYYICDMINGSFSGWKDVYTSGYKPYVTGSVTATSHTITTNHGFQPSAVLYSISEEDYNVRGTPAFDSTSFTALGNIPSSGALVSYIIFK